MLNQTNNYVVVRSLTTSAAVYNIEQTKRNELAPFCVLSKTPVAIVLRSHHDTHARQLQTVLSEH